MKPDFKTKTLRGVYSVNATCDDCDWECCSRNSAGLAAQHHYRTGHTIHVETESGFTMTREGSAWHEGWKKSRGKE